MFRMSGKIIIKIEYDRNELREGMIMKLSFNFEDWGFVIL